MIEVYHISKAKNIVGTSLYSRRDLIEIFGKRAAERILKGKKYTDRKYGITRMTRQAYNKAK